MLSVITLYLDQTEILEELRERNEDLARFRERQEEYQVAKYYGVSEEYAEALFDQCKKTDWRLKRKGNKKCSKRR